MAVQNVKIEVSPETRERAKAIAIRAASSGSCFCNHAPCGGDIYEYTPSSDVGLDNPNTIAVMHIYSIFFRPGGAQHAKLIFTDSNQNLYFGWQYQSGKVRVLVRAE